jgi:5'-3' exonuclease
MTSLPAPFMNTIALIDGNSIGFLAQNSKVKLKAGDQETQAVFGSIKIIRRLVQSNPNCLVLWDGRSWRKDVFESYKAQRTATPEQRAIKEAYKAQSDQLRRAIQSLGLTQALASNYEADDLAAVLAPRYAAKDYKVRLFTTDRDWLQLVGPNVTWEDFHSGLIVTPRNFEEYTGLPNVRQFVESKALKGDASDNIPCVGAIGEIGARKLLSVWGSVPNFLRDANREETWKAATGKNLTKALTTFAEDREKIERFKQNMRLMTLFQTQHFPPITRLERRNGAFDRAGFLQVCRELGFTSIMSDVDRFMAPFTPKGDASVVA